MNSEKNSRKEYNCRKCGVKLVLNQNIAPLSYQKVKEVYRWEQYCHSCDITVDRSFKIAEQQKYEKILKANRLRQFNEWAKDLDTDEPFTIKKPNYKPNNAEENSSLKKFTCKECGETKLLKNPPEHSLCRKCKEKEITHLRKLIRGFKNASIILYPPKELIDFLTLNFPYGYDNYQEILSMEFEKPLSKTEAYDESTLRNYYNRLGHLGTRIHVKCEECKKEFTYIYIGGPKRHSCPNCTDWSKKFPLESGTYWIINPLKAK